MSEKNLVLRSMLAYIPPPKKKKALSLDDKFNIPESAF